jgi:hypothetical protein
MCQLEKLSSFVKCRKRALELVQECRFLTWKVELPSSSASTGEVVARWPSWLHPDITRLLLYTGVQLIQSRYRRYWRVTNFHVTLLAGSQKCHLCDIFSSCIYLIVHRPWVSPAMRYENINCSSWSRKRKRKTLVSDRQPVVVSALVDQISVQLDLCLCSSCNDPSTPRTGGGQSPVTVTSRDTKSDICHTPKTLTHRDCSLHNILGSIMKV